ncbi:poly(A)-binding protein binding protein [Sporothrix epigloea]|uniref:Poly(A)-binding protein binding protein n=1 Tax=Sporothrix epigloea TaxID=1892477 RepID=A0ABP0DCM4_9PEZI
MPSQRKDGTGFAGGSSRPSNAGQRSSFRTDTAISNSRAGGDRNLKRWVGDGSADLDGSLESAPTSGGKWDQFAENERLFGLKTDYNENFYTTAIDRSHPQYSERFAKADRAAREIERSAPTTAHVAEERVMDFAGGQDQGGDDEEDKYSGVRRQQDFPPFSSSRTDAKYTPPARRAPAAHSTVVGAPVDPAIISAQIKGGYTRKQQQAATPKPDETKSLAAASGRPSAATVALPQIKTPEPQSIAAPSETLQQTSKSFKASSEQQKPAAVTKSNNKTTTPAVSPGNFSTSASATPGRASISPAAKTAVSAAPTSATASPAPTTVANNVENALLKDFKDFASQQRQHAEKARHNKIKADAQVKLQELRRFADSFKLSTPVPKDLISIIAKDPEKQRKIQEKALQNAEELAKSKADSSFGTRGSVSSASSAKAPLPATHPTASAAGVASTAASNNTTTSSTPNPLSSNSSVSHAAKPESSRPTAGNVRSQGPHASYSATQIGAVNRHNNARGGYMQQNFRQQSQPFRGDRSGPQHLSQGHNTGHLAERIRNSEQNLNRYNKNLNGHNGHSHSPSHFSPSGDARLPPTGPAIASDGSHSRRQSALPAGAHTPQKLNPTTHEFRPSPFAASFNPTGLSAGASPRSSINHPTIDYSQASSTAATLAPSVPSPRTPGIAIIRRKTHKAVTGKCDILKMIKSIKPPQGRNWDDNNGMRPSYDTALLWRQVQDDEAPESTMHLKYTEYLERLAFSAASMATPVQGHAMPHLSQMVHQHQLPVHMQQGGHLAPRPNQHMPALHMHAGAGGPHGHIPQVSFNGSDDHRMMHSSSAQSFASPRMSQVPLYPQPVGSTPQMGYNQAVMPYMQGNHQMNQFRNFPINPQGYMPSQSGPMMPMVSPQHFVTVPGGMMGSQQMAMYPGGPQYMGHPGAGAPPHQMTGSNGYPSPGRPAAPMMGQQGSQQGQPMYGMTPNIQFQQPAFSPQNTGQGGKAATRGGYNTPSSQQFGTSPQGVHQYGPPYRNGNGNNSGKTHHNNHNNSHPHAGPTPHQSSQTNGVAAGQQSRQNITDGTDKAK